VASREFSFDTEFTLLDVGATGALVRSGSVRPSVLAYDGHGGVDAVVLEWSEEAGPEEAFEAARRWLRQAEPIAYGFVVLFTREEGKPVYLRASDRPGEGSVLGLCLYSNDGAVRGALYPVRRGPTGSTLGVPTITDSETSDWCPIGDIWANPFCVGDIVSFRPPERAVDPESPLWKAIVDLTKLRVQTDRYKSREYMLFLDDLRNGVFAVAGRSAADPMQVALKPRTTYNPLGYIVVEASKLLLISRQERSTGRDGVA